MPAGVASFGVAPVGVASVGAAPGGVESGRGAGPGPGPTGATLSRLDGASGQDDRAAPGSAARAGGDAALSSEVAVLALADLAPASRLWGWSRFVLGRRAARGSAGLRFVKVLGSGEGGGFGLKPSASIQGLFCVFDDDASADAFLAASGPFEAWRRRAREHFSVKLRAWSSRGSWSGHRFGIAARPPAAAQAVPVAALTRASIRPSRARAFWAMEPAAERDLEAARGCLLAAGVGEAPLLRQATFSVWESVAAMDAYARTGAHLAAIRASARGAFFSESAFVRFVPYGARGTWRGRRLDA
jgi:spheroidene monooxygenase